MGPRSWASSVNEDSVAQVTLDPPSAAADRFQIQFPVMVSGVAGDGLLVTGDGVIDDHRIRSEAGLPVSDVTVTIPHGYAVERLVVRGSSRRIVVYLPSTTLLELCEGAIEGGDPAAADLIELFEAPLQIPLVCGAFLGVAETVRLVAALVQRDRFVQSQIHSYRYAIVRSAVVSPTGLYVNTYRELNELVDGLDAISEIGEVSLIDALADVMATVHDSPEDTEQLLDTLGVAVEQLADRDDGLFTACFLAHIVCSTGVEAALGYEPPSKLPPRGHYERRKRAVFRAEYGIRGTAWRRLLNAARRESTDEVGYVLAYTLYWTGEESRSDSRMAELLFRGAELVAADYGLRKIEAKSRYERLIAAGHRLRGTHSWSPSIDNFETAREMAADHYFIDEWESMLAKGLVVSRALSQNGDHSGAVDALDTTIEDLLSRPLPKSVANRTIRHLRAQKCEIESLLYRSDDPARARGLLGEARDHYEAIGFERSRDKIERMLANLPAVSPGAEVESSRTTEVDSVIQLTDDASKDSATAPALDPGVDHDDPVETEEDWLDSIEYPDEDDLTGRYDQRFEELYMF